LDDIIEYNKYVAEKIRGVYWDHNPISPIPNGQEKSFIFLGNYYIVGGIAQSTPDKMSIVAWHNPPALDWDGVFDHKTK
jgi:hypothetical protein